MSSSDWDIEAVIARDGFLGGMAKWHTLSTRADRLPPPQVQAIPGAYLNDFEVSTTDGAWALGPDGAGGDVAYFAPFETGVFSAVASVPKEPGVDMGYVILPFPDGVVYNQVGTRRIILITKDGLLHDQVLPVMPMGDSTVAPYAIRLRMVCILPNTTGYTLALAVGTTGNLPTSLGDVDSVGTQAVAASFTEPFTPGEPITVRPELFVVPETFGGGGNHRLCMVPADIYDRDEVMCVTGRRGCARSMRGSQYELYRYVDTEEVVS